MLATQTLRSAETVFPPEELDPNLLVVAYLVKRMRELPKESLHDLAELAPDLAECKTPDDLREIAETMREILFPELLGDVKEVPARRTDKLRSYAEWFAKTIKSKREELGWTQEQLANESGLPQSHISRLENAQHSPSEKTRERIANAMGLNKDELDPSSW